MVRNVVIVMKGHSNLVLLMVLVITLILVLMMVLVVVMSTCMVDYGDRGDIMILVVMYVVTVTKMVTVLMYSDNIRGGAVRNGAW